MIKILSSSLVRQAILKDIIDPNRFEEINGENTLTFGTVLDKKASTYINENAVVELDDDYFDVAYYKKNQNENGTLTVDVETEHVSYRLNNTAYDLDSFASTGTPTAILMALLAGTCFTVGTVEYTANVTYSAQEKKSRRQLLMEFVAYLGGEVVFNKFEISIVQHRGATEPQLLTTGKNLKVISKIFNKRETDAAGNPLMAYTCEPIQLPDKPLNLGDEVILIQKDLGIQEQMRVVRHGYNPYDLREADFELANFVSGVEDQMYRIATTTVTKDKLYYGAKIGPENGFESIRSDNKARAYFNADNFVMQSGDGTGNNWTDKLYFDPATGEYIFDGRITLTDLENLLVSLYKDIQGGKLELYDTSQNTEVEMGVASEAGENVGGVMLLYNNGKSNPRITLGIIEAEDAGSIQALDSSGTVRIQIQASVTAYDGALIGLRNSSGSLVTRLTENAGYINNQKIAIQDWVTLNFAGNAHTHSQYLEADDDDYVHSETGANISIAATSTGITIRKDGSVLGSIPYV